MGKRTKRKLEVHLTERSLRDIAGIETYSVAQFGRRVAQQYLAKLESAIKGIESNPQLLRAEPAFHETLRFFRVEKHLLVCETAIPGMIIVLTVIYASMDIPARLAELEPGLALEVEMLLQKLQRGRGT